MHNHETFVVEYLKDTTDDKVDSLSEDPLREHSRPLHVSYFLCKHLLFDQFQDIPLMKLEIAIFLIEFLSFFPVHIADIDQKLPTVFAHLTVELLLLIEKPNGLSVLFLHIFLNWCVFVIIFQDLVVFFFKLLDVDLFFPLVILLLANFLLIHSFIELFNFFRHRFGRDFVGAGSDTDGAAVH